MLLFYWQKKQQKTEIKSVFDWVSSGPNEYIGHNSVNVSTSLVMKISCQKRNNQSSDKMYIDFVISMK